MTLETRNYNPAQVVCSFGSVIVRGYMDGQFIRAARDEKSFSHHTGAGGDVTRIRNLNQAGVVTLTLIASSPTNDEFSAILKSDELFGNGIKPLLIKELNGTTLVQADAAWLDGFPEVAYSKEVEGREWMIACAQMMPLVGGLVV